MYVHICVSESGYSQCRGGCEKPIFEEDMMRTGLALAIVFVLTVTSTFMYLMTSSSSGNNVECSERNEVLRDGECVSKFSILRSELKFETGSTRVKTQSSGLRTRSGKYLHEVEGEILVKYTVRNVDSRDLIISVHQTPLSNAMLTKNVISSYQEDFHYVGIIAEDFGEFGEFVVLRPNETLTNTFDLGPNVQVSLTEGTTRLWLDFEIRVFDENYVLAGKFDMTDASTNEIEILQGDMIEIEFEGPLPPEENDDGHERRRRLSSSILYEDSKPYWNYVCEDVPASQTGYTSGGQPAPCSILGSVCSVVSTLCPVTCNTCSETAAQWTKPWTDKTFTVVNEYSTSDKNLLIAADRTKDDMCATLLYCMEKKTTDCQNAVKKWWGGDASSTSQWETLRSGYTRICSSNNYKYNLNPSANCGITYKTSSSSSEVSTQQGDVALSTRNSLIANCISGTYCYYSGTIAWVYGSRPKEREMNMCQILFWVQDDVQQPVNGGSKMSTIIHELSHFVDLADTDDLEYNRANQLSVAISSPWTYINNAATWDAMSDEDDGGTWTWSDFDTGSSDVNGGWCAWQTCSESCGGGTQSRTCACPSKAGNGADCVGSATQACNTEVCDVNGGWCAWQTCSLSCGGGTQTRACACPSKAGNGADCVGSATQACNTQSCGTDGGWCSWTSCSATCGGGVRTRECACPAQSGNGDDCNGQSWESCNVQDCPPGPINGGWCNYDACTETCGGGTKTRSCACPTAENGGNDCVGDATTTCNTDACPEITTQAPDDNDDDDDDDDDDDGQKIFGLDLIVAAAAGGGALLLLICVLVLFYCYCFKKDSKTKQQVDTMDMYSYDHDIHVLDHQLSSSSSSSRPKPRPKPKPRRKITNGSRVRAIHKYKSQRHDELTIKKGDILEVYTVQVDGWCYGRSNRSGKKGVFPKNFVKLI